MATRPDSFPVGDVIAEINTVIAAGDAPHGTERDLVYAFKVQVRCGLMEDRIPQTPHDTIAYEMAFKYGRADIVIFHFDGSASVIEVKDGTKGYNHVVSGIGQSALYASQLAMTRGAVTRVRKCLLWSSTGDVMADAAIEQACEESGVVPLPWQSMRSLMATDKAVDNLRSMQESLGESCH